MKARSFIGDRDTPGNNDDYDPWRGNKTVILGINYSGRNGLNLEMDEKLYFRDIVTFKIAKKTQDLYTDFRLFVRIPADERIEPISLGSEYIVFNILQDYINKYDRNMNEAVNVELTLKYTTRRGKRKESSGQITIHPSGQQLNPIFTKII